MKKSKLLVLSLLAVSAIGLASCQGAQGPKGDTGDAGAPGEKGDQGTPGKDGTNGKSVLNGEGAPKDTLGSDGDSYIDYSTFDYYVKENGKWVKKGNIKGEKGEDGAQGPKGDDGAKGEKGDTGSQGPTGPQGNKGATAWSNTILQTDGLIVTPEKGSYVTNDENVVFYVTISDTTKGESVYLTITNGDDTEVLKPVREGDNKFKFTTTMKDGGFVVQANFETLREAINNERQYIALVSDASLGTSDLTTKSATNIDLNGFNIDVNGHTFTVNSDVTFSNSDASKTSEVKDGTTGTQAIVHVTSSNTTSTASEVKNANAISAYAFNNGLEKYSEASNEKASLTVKERVSIIANSTGSAVKTDGVNSNVTIEPNAEVKNTSSGNAIEVTGAGEVKVEGKASSSSGTAVKQSAENASVEVKGEATGKKAIEVTAGSVTISGNVSGTESAISVSKGSVEISGTVTGGTTSAVEVSGGSVSVTKDGSVKPLVEAKGESTTEVKTGNVIKVTGGSVEVSGTVEGGTTSAISVSSGSVSVADSGEVKASTSTSSESSTTTTNVINISGGEVAVSGTVSGSNNVVNVTGGSVKVEGDKAEVKASAGTAVTQSGSATLTIGTGGTVSGTDSAVKVSGGTVKVESGNVKATGDNSSSAISVDSSTSDKVNISLDNATVSSENTSAKAISNTGNSGTVSVIDYDNSIKTEDMDGISDSSVTKLDGGTTEQDFVFDKTNKTYSINNLEGLKKFQSYVNDKGVDFEGFTIKLTKDIDISSIDNWTPIGTGKRSGASYTSDSKLFKGIFDGGGYTIKNLKIDGTKHTNASNDAVIGLFGVVSGTVKNVKFENVSISISTEEQTGSAVGLLVDGGTVKDVTVESGSISGTEGTGGVIGRVSVWGTVDNCTNKATVNGSSYNIGGIIGAAFNTNLGKTMAISNCHNYGAITGKSTGVGGIVGLSAAEISDCTNEAAITGNGTSIGGIAGEQQNYGLIQNCTNSGLITNNSDEFGTGGIVGWVRYNGNTSRYLRFEKISLIKNKNTGSINGGSSAGGIVGHVYNAIVAQGNINEAGTINSSNFAAGIIGTIQNTETPNSSNVKVTDFTITGNTSKTKLENMTGTGQCKTLIVWNNIANVDYSKGDVLIIDRNNPIENDNSQVKTADELVNAVENEGLSDIYLNNNIKLNAALEIKRSVTIHGMGFTLSVPETSTGRVINIEDNEGDEIDLTLIGVNIKGPTIDGLNRGISMYGNTCKVKLVIEGCSVSANHYALNIASDNKDVEVFAKNSTFTGYAAVQTWSANSKFTFEDCILKGVNQWEKGNGDNDFGTIVVNDVASGSQFNFTNCKIYATEQKTAKELLLDIRTNSKLEFEDCEFYYNDASVASTLDDVKKYSSGDWENITLTIK